MCLLCVRCVWEWDDVSVLHVLNIGMLLSITHAHTHTHTHTRTHTHTHTIALKMTERFGRACVGEILSDIEKVHKKLPTLEKSIHAHRHRNRHTDTLTHTVQKREGAYTYLHTLGEMIATRCGG